jgi:hypothetical protein
MPWLVVRREYLVVCFNAVTNVSAPFGRATDSDDEKELAGG